MSEISPKEFKAHVAKSKTFFNKAFADVPEEKEDVKKAIVDQLAFATVNLQTLQEDIIENGPIVLFVNGSQEMMRENPAQKSYVSVINRWTALVKELNGLLPKDVAPVEIDASEDIIKMFKGEK
ncbi:hypothetical protein KQH86_04325 [Weissella confusa]|uniref:hypothetical protein n=1 Tax=Weissella confusa TaxID=1583 RepID=UPI001783B5E6|nr:hypothetical protein [Weissella confusa]MBD5832678.1 hypothetical protein [Weissella confusa]MBJ7630673.1 hypothetical protein [Weissella confusa]MBJ7678794.1 hypothetical protein [Weissella confusa]MBU5285319.1 hypothetical protein [Weissella confusa]